MITVVSLLFSESSERPNNYFFGNVRSYSLLTIFCVNILRTKKRDG